MVGAEEALGDHPAGGYGVHDDPALLDAGVDQDRRDESGEEDDDDNGDQA
ncbi:hypothetical protein NCCP2495_24810 [Dietzia sp. NCCP-2495]|nr:hypothetical protein NCCP2495_24810 [Dietzia sp. NCCP-2495]